MYCRKEQMTRMLTEEQNRKYRALCGELTEMKTAAVAFSAGVDSAFLAKAAHDVLGDGMAAVTAVSETLPESERKEADAFCRTYGIRHIEITRDELSIPGFHANPANRCYLCKNDLFRRVREVADREGLAFVCDGTNADDTGDYRPGLVAIREQGVRTPLKDAGLTKQDIRDISEEMGLPTWNKPSFACLSSRFPYGDEITREGLSMVEQAENVLKNLGFHQYRVRDHRGLARIEILPEEFPKILDDAVRLRITGALKEIGFRYVSLDLSGYHTGSMNPAGAVNAAENAQTEEKETHA